MDTLDKRLLGLLLIIAVLLIGVLLAQYFVYSQFMRLNSTTTIIEKTVNQVVPSVSPTVSPSTTRTPALRTTAPTATGGATAR